MNLITQLEKQNADYWRTRIRVLNTQKAARAHDKLKKGREVCRQETNRLLRTGFLTRLTCQECGSIEAEVHHLNYNDPINVLFLCQKHHKEWHKNNRTVPGGEYFM